MEAVDHLRPDPPLGGTPLTVVWEVVGEVLRSTVTSQAVGAFWTDPTAGPFARASGPEGAEVSALGFVFVEGTGLVTPIVRVAHVVSNLANASARHDGFSSLEPLSELLAVADEGDGTLGAIEVGGVPIAVGSNGAAERLYGSLVRLPPDVDVTLGALAAAQGVSWPSPVPPRRGPSRAPAPCTIDRRPH